MTHSDLRYPLGAFSFAEARKTETKQQWLQEISEAPAALAAAVQGLTGEQLDTPYRPDGWTVRQVVHHLADSHVNAFLRVKLALTEDCPTVKPYDEVAWTALADYELPVDTSLQLFTHVHARFAAVLQSVTAEQAQRTMLHPENGMMTVEQLMAMYAWHGKHHIRHITALRERMGWV